MEQKTKEEIIQELETLCQEEGFIYSLSGMVRKDFFFEPSEMADINWRDKLSFQELNFLLGLMVKKPVSLNIPPEENLERQISTTYKLLSSLHDAHTAPMMKNLIDGLKDKIPVEDYEKNYMEVFGSGEAMSEPMFYGGSGAYDFQYLQFAPIRYSLDKQWLEDKKGINLSKIAEIASFLKVLSEVKAHIKPKELKHVEMCKTALETFCFTEKELSKFADSDVKALLQNFSLTPDSVSHVLDSVGSYNEAVSHPIVRLSDGRYFMPSQFMLTESIYQSPFYWMNDDKQYRDKLSNNKGQTAEEIVSVLLEPVFGKGNIYKNVKVKNGQDDVTDIDVLAVIGNKAIALQVKSKKLTELSRKGNTEKLLEDFKGAVQQSYNQGILSRSAILKNGNTLEKDGMVFTLHEEIDEVFIMCVSLEHYPAITHQVEMYLERKDSDPFPIALSIFDLDILAFYLHDPFEFLYYVRQRIENYGYFKASSEIALLGFHLKQKLFKMKEANFVMVPEDYAQLVDANFPTMRGSVPMNSAVEKLHHKWKNDQFNQLVKRVKETGIAGFTDAVLFLYDMSGDGADNLIRQIERTKAKGKSDGLEHDFSILNDDHKTGITYRYLPHSPEKMETKLMTLAMARKYKSKGNQWLALGTIGNSKDIVDVVAFNKQPWEYDSNLEKLASVALITGKAINVKTGRKLGVNEPCPCGSGKKYKKCCRP